MYQLGKNTQMISNNKTWKWFAEITVLDEKQITIIQHLLSGVIDGVMETELELHSGQIQKKIIDDMGLFGIEGCVSINAETTFINPTHIN